MADKKSNYEVLNDYFTLGNSLVNLAGKFEVINIDVNVTMKHKDDIEDDQRRKRFLGDRYLELVDELVEAGIVIPEWKQE